MWSCRCTAPAGPLSRPRCARCRARSCSRAPAAGSPLAFRRAECELRLFYQSLGASRRGADGAYAQKLAAIVQGAAAPGTSVEVHGLGPGKAIADQYRYLEFRDTGEILDNGLRAEREGYDAFLIGNIFEPGLHALRELLNIPVLGLCEASVHLACLMGARFSVVNVNEKFARRVAENIVATGLAGRLASMEEIEVERAGQFDRAFEDDAARDAVIERVRAAARRGIAKGAECVIPAGEDRHDD